MARKKKKRQRTGLVHLDPHKVSHRAISLGMTKTQIADDAKVSRNTVYRAFDGDGVFPASAVKIANVLRVSDVTALMPSAESLDNGTLSDESGEWAVDDYLGPWVTTSNRLQYRVCRMKHKFVDNKYGRGKWYDLLNPSIRDRDSLKVHLLRHSEVCERIGVHSHLTENLSTRPGSTDAWWVIDRWVGDRTLDDVIADGEYPKAELSRLAREILLGLERLHAAEIFFRELAPSRILLAEGDGRVVLTDFELAKLVDAPTVSANWPEDPYRAPEVESGIVDHRCDLYSWARVMLHAATGSLPPKGRDTEAAQTTVWPMEIETLVSECLSPMPSDRPPELKAILHEVNRWAESTGDFL